MGVIPTSFDEWAERVKLRFLIGGLIGLLVSGCSTITETRYLVFGKETQAEIKSVNENAGRSSRNGTWSVKYEFEEEDGAVRNEEDYGSGSLALLGTGGVIDIEYIPGSLENSRILGHHYRWRTIPFLICLVIVGIASWKFMKEYREHERRERARG